MSDRLSLSRIFTLKKGSSKNLSINMAISDFLLWEMKDFSPFAFCRSGEFLL
ncbi:MAG: hypothetical protein F6K48_30475 [Okeania sp. SIO3H1]|uniref:hypothetical protein n=1 Tax=Okeania sp. SIO1I7 TaxID=2607772 RepID=UPI0013CB1746|nr:hypothetical protein [Okeania sp. SIO1I7]NEN92983.1 hypothetical protein [Okeania sp. SIO3H1]NET29196.1 hypothetical protein [Okeania sp. SIO1I7]